MAIDETLASHVRAALAGASSVREVKMFGGLGFMLQGNMIAACSHRGLLVRGGETAMAKALSRGAQPMIMNGRTMKGFVWVTEATNGRSVNSWLRLARRFVESLPVKKRTHRPAKKRGTKS